MLAAFMAGIVMEVAVQETYQVLVLGVSVSAESSRNNGEGVGNTVLGIVKRQLGH